MSDIKNNGGDLNGDSKTPVPDIPDLKKKEKEKKRSGVAWSGGPAPAAAARAAASAAASASAGAASQAVGIGLSLGAKLLMGLVTAAVVGGGAVAMNRYFSAGAGGGANLGGIASTIKIHKAGTDSNALKYAAQEGRGELKFDQTAKGLADSQKAAEPPAADKAQEAPPANQLADGGVQPSVPTNPQLDHNLSAAKLSTSFGNQFGGKNIFAGSSGPKFGGDAGLKAPNLKITGVRGRSGAMARGTSVASAGRMRGIKGLTSTKAFGQLRNMGSINKAIRQGGASASETNSSAATQQFEGNTPGSQSKAPTALTDKLPTVNPILGGGTADITQVCSATQLGAGCIVEGTACVCNPSHTNTNATPWQSDVDEARKLNTYIPLGMMAVGVLLLAGMTAAWASVCSAGYSAVPFFIMAAVMAAMILAMAIKMITLGQKINAKGGKPQGDLFEKLGYIYSACATMLLISAIISAASPLGNVAITSVASIFTSLAPILAVIAVLSTMIASLLIKK